MIFSRVKRILNCIGRAQPCAGCKCNYLGKAPLQAGQKLYLYKKVMESIHKTPWHMILAPGALVCPKACDSAILSQEILLALPVTILRILFRSSEEHSCIASHLTIGLADHIDKTEAGSCFSAVREQTCQNCRTLFECMK